MKKAKVCIDFQNDKIFKFDRKVDLCFSSTPHYCIDIKNRNVEPLDVKWVILLFLKACNLCQSNKNRKQQLR